LHSSYIKVLVDRAVHFEPEKVIKYDFKPGSVERSLDLYQRGYTSAGNTFKRPPPIKIEQFSSGNFPMAIKIQRPFFKFDSIKDILEA
jgi:hypothetical protein